MIKLSAPIAAAVLVCACAGYPTAPNATAQLAPTKGNAAAGTVTFTKQGKAHGAHASSEHHAGDLASLKADANGVARFSYTSTSITVGEGVTDIIGRGLIVHRDADDFKTQPTGNSGPRMACAVIARG